MTLQERRNLVDLHRSTRCGAVWTVIAIRGSSFGSEVARVFVAAGGDVAGDRSLLALQGDLVMRSEASLPAGAQVHRIAVDCATPVAEPAEIHLLAESAEAVETEALMDALEANMRGEYRVMATVLPSETAPLLRFVMDARGDVLFVSESLETEDLVPLRRIALRSAHGDCHRTALGEMFVETMESARAQR